MISTAKGYRQDVIKTTSILLMALQNSKILHYVTFDGVDMLKAGKREKDITCYISTKSQIS